MLSDGIIVLYWIPITIILISIGQFASFTTAFPKSRSFVQTSLSIVRASKNEIERPANFIDEKNMEQSLFNPPPRSKKMMNQRGVITDVEDVVVNLPLGKHSGSTVDKTRTLPLFSTSTKLFDDVPIHLHCHVVVDLYHSIFYCYRAYCC